MIAYSSYVILCNLIHLIYVLCNASCDGHMTVIRTHVNVNIYSDFLSISI